MKHGMNYWIGVNMKLTKLVKIASERNTMLFRLKEKNKSYRYFFCATDTLAKSVSKRLTDKSFKLFNMSKNKEVLKYA